MPGTVPVNERVDDPDIMIKIGLRFATRPIDGDTAELKETLPMKPLIEAMVTIDVPGTPTFTVTVGAATIVKSTKWKRIVAVVRDRVPSVPVTTTV